MKAIFEHLTRSNFYHTTLYNNSYFKKGWKYVLLTDRAIEFKGPIPNPLNKARRERTVSVETYTYSPTYSIKLPRGFYFHSKPAPVGKFGVIPIDFQQDSFSTPSITMLPFQKGHILAGSGVLEFEIKADWKKARFIDILNWIITRRMRIIGQYDSTY